MITRRQFLISATAGICVPNLAVANEATRLTAEPVEFQILTDQKPTSLWGFNGLTPGPIMRTQKGKRVRVSFKNGLNVPSAIHWHGIHIDNAMDGVPGLTQSPVEPGNRFLYDFVVPDAGTYWYHSHFQSVEQVARGLYGALIVEEDNPPVVDHDIVVIVDDWRLKRDGSQAGDFDNLHDQAHAGRLGNFAKVVFQGLSSSIKRNERIRLRLVNTATARIFSLQISGLDGKVVAYDGMPLETLEPIDNLILAPAQRIDLIADVIGEEVAFDFQTRGGLFRLGLLPVEGLAMPKEHIEIIPLEPNRYRIPDLGDAVQLRLEMEGGAMSHRMRSGNMTSDNIWTFNGAAGLTDQALHTFQLGKTGVIEFINETRFPHGLHLHGHHFQELKNGDRLGPLRDTILVDAGQTINMACVFDNLGKWLLHCHMLAHQAAGMKTWVEVV